MALGDLIYIQLTQSIVGYGNATDVLQVVETAYIQALIAEGFVVVVAGPGTPYAQSSPGELAYAENISNTPTTATAGGALIPNTAISLPASTRPLYIDIACAFAIGTYGGGSLNLTLQETTGGSPVLYDNAAILIPGPVTDVGPNSKTGLTAAKMGIRVGPRAALSTWALYAYLLVDTSSGLTATVLNKPRNLGQPSTICGYAR